MRMLLQVELDTPTTNKALEDGSLADIMKGALEKLQPEAAYFTVLNGHRTALIVLDVAEIADMPSIGEQFFLKLNARVSLTPVMNAEDLVTGLGRLAL